MVSDKATHINENLFKYLLLFSGGPVVRLKGSITSMSFLDSYGSIIPYTFETWRDEKRDNKDRKHLDFIPH